MSVANTYNGGQTTMHGNTREDIVQAAWQYTPAATALLRTAVNYTRQTDLTDLNHIAVLGRSEAREFASRHDTSISLGPHDTLEAGAEARMTRQDYGSYYRWDVADWAPAQTFAPVGRFVAHNWRYGAYLQNSWNGFGGRLLLNAGGRFDRLSSTGQHVWSLPRRRYPSHHPFYQAHRGLGPVLAIPHATAIARGVPQPVSPGPAFHSYHPGLRPAHRRTRPL